MKQFNILSAIAMIIFFSLFSQPIKSQEMKSNDKNLSIKEKRIIRISSYTAKGDLIRLKKELNEGLNAGLRSNEIKEILVHTYAYCGFPRSIRGLQTFMEVLDDRKSAGIHDVAGREAFPVDKNRDKYESGRNILEKLTKTSQSGTLTGYSEFAPVIDTFLKEHLFADIFERDLLTYAQRELVTVSVLSTIAGVEPMLNAHFKICLNVGLTSGQLTELVTIIDSTAGKKESKAAETVLEEVLKNRKSL